MAVRPKLLSLLPIAAVSLGLALSGCTPLGTFVEFGEPGAASAHRIPGSHSDRDPVADAHDQRLRRRGADRAGRVPPADCVRLTDRGSRHPGACRQRRHPDHQRRRERRERRRRRLGHHPGSVNEVDTLDLETLDLNGRFNWIGVHGSVDRVAIDGDDNEVLADGDVGQVEDRGERNVVGSQP